MPAQGVNIRAFVSVTSNKGCFLRLSASLTARVLIRDLADEFVKDPSVAFPTGKLVDARVLKVSGVDGADSGHGVQIECSLRPSVVIGAAANKELSALVVNEVVHGTVHRVVDFGVFVAIKNTSLIGLSRRDMALEDSKDIFKSFEIDIYIFLSKQEGNAIWKFKIDRIMKSCFSPRILCI